ncbi:MAG: hypothetical protein ABI548_11870 [Polyangiaceae bacterium]
MAKLQKPRLVKAYLSKLAKPVAKGRAKLRAPALTVSELAVDYYARRVEKGVKNARGERRWFELHVQELLGSHLPKSVTVDDAERVLLAAKKKGLAKESVTKVRAEIGRLWNFFIKGNLTSVNMGELADMPRMDADERPRQILSNEEFVQYLGHPDELHWTPSKEAARKAAGTRPLIDREVKTLATIARCVGGARTLDLHALTWEMIDVTEWKTIRIFRPKTKRKDIYYLPEMVVPALKQWWTDHEKPSRQDPCSPRGLTADGEGLTVRPRREPGNRRPTPRRSGVTSWLPGSTGTSCTTTPTPAGRSISTRSVVPS